MKTFEKYKKRHDTYKDITNITNEHFRYCNNNMEDAVQKLLDGLEQHVQAANDLPTETYKQVIKFHASEVDYWQTQILEKVNKVLNDYKKSYLGNIKSILENGK